MSERRFAAQLFALLFAVAAGGPAHADPACERLRGEMAAVVLQVAYYPYPSKLRVHLDLSALRAAAALDAAELVVRDPSGRPMLERAIEMPSAERHTEVVLDLPELADGVHRVGVRFAPSAGCALAGPERSFERRRFAWERNALGRSPAVIPPFTPLQASAERVDVVGRRYHLAGSGLWKQIEAQGESLLAGPVRLEAEADGRALAWEVREPHAVVSRSESRVETRSRLEAGALRLGLRQVYEVDGLVRVDLHLAGPATTRLERLDLVIPLRPRRASLLDAITDGTRHHQLGATPKGRGVVWDATQVGRDVLPEGFVPYVWLGDEERGLAWLAESTRDWLVDAHSPVQQIRRRPGVTELVVRFVTAPGALGRDRHLSFAIQATPAKPRPEGWRSWLLACEPFDDAERICPLGSGLYWGAGTPFGSVHPLGGDDSVFTWFADARRGGRAPRAAISGWLRAHVPDPAQRQRYRDSFAFTFASLASQPDHVIAYVNAQGVAATPAFRTFVDEWRFVPFGDRAGRDADEHGEVKIQSTRSYHDYALWHLARMLDSGAFDGFFFDNTYLRASYDDVVGPAYRNDRGELVPGVALFALRDFLRRAQTLVYERRGRWLNLAHMTTTPVAPVHVWAGITLDGEWKYGRSAYPERFPSDFLRAASLGSQTGTLPAYLHGLDAGLVGNERARLERQLAGWLAAHEIRVWARLDGALADVWRALFDAGYARPECRVSRYWDRPAAFRVEGVDAAALVVACGREALALVASAGGGGAARLRLAPGALGLGGVVACEDAERSGRVALAPDGCDFALARYETRLIRVRGAR